MNRFITSIYGMIDEWAQQQNIPLHCINSFIAILSFFLIVMVFVLFCANVKKNRQLMQSNIKTAELNRLLTEVRHKYNSVCFQYLNFKNEVDRKNRQKITENRLRMNSHQTWHLLSSRRKNCLTNRKKICTGIW